MNITSQDEVDDFSHHLWFFWFEISRLFCHFSGLAETYKIPRSNPFTLASKGLHLNISHFCDL
jgi:hypothetical protein